MKLFWEDSQGRTPPKEAKFFWRPFYQQTTFPLSFSERVEQLPPPSFFLKPILSQILPSKKEWIRRVEQTLEAIDRKLFEKAVLTRCIVLESPFTINPWEILSRLKKKRNGGVLFGLVDQETSFLGLTPETLFIQKGSSIETEALAGTRKRGETFQEDQRLEEELLNSPKDLQEWKIVETFLQEKLSSLCTPPLQSSPIQVKKTANVQHLHAGLRGTLLKQTPQDLILDKLHPTPAIAGRPKEKALEWISRIESFDRGLYGSSLGWEWGEEREWIVAIRSCLIRSRFIYLYAGVGIVEGSDPEKEWEELDAKIELYKDIFL